MKRQSWGLYVIALAVLIVGLVAVGVPASTLLIGALVLTCPLMMLVMMRSMHGGDTSHHNPSARTDDRPTASHDDNDHLIQHHDTVRR